VEAVLGEHSPSVSIDERPVKTSTRIVAAGGYVLTLSTVLQDHGTELHSTYTGHPLAPETLVSEIFLAPNRKPQVASRHADPRELPVLYGRKTCLYDHLMRLHELVSELGHARVAIAELDTALDVVRS
jgi:hypothetical protein